METLNQVIGLNSIISHFLLRFERKTTLKKWVKYLFYYSTNIPWFISRSTTYYSWRNTMKMEIQSKFSSYLLYQFYSTAEFAGSTQIMKKIMNICYYYAIKLLGQNYTLMFNFIIQEYYNDKVFMVTFDLMKKHRRTIFWELKKIYHNVGMSFVTVASFTRTCQYRPPTPPAPTEIGRAHV